MKYDYLAENKYLLAPGTVILVVEQLTKEK